MSKLNKAQEKWYCTKHGLRHGQKYPSCVQVKLTLNKAQEKRFDGVCKKLDITLLFSDVNILKQHLADELATQKKEMVKKLENMVIEEVGNSSKTLDQAIETIKNDK